MPNEAYNRVRISWADVEALIDRLVEQLRGRHFDYVIGISRGGLIPTGLLAKRLYYFNVLVASIQGYDEKDVKLDRPVLLEFPAEPILHGKDVLIVDDVWDTGDTIALVRKIVDRAGGRPSPPRSTGSPSAPSTAARPISMPRKRTIGSSIPGNPLNRSSDRRCNMTDGRRNELILQLLFFHFRDPETDIHPERLRLNLGRISERSGIPQDELHQLGNWLMEQLAGQPIKD